ncbi:MAG: M16 family metallopeptidase [Gammaproteobacteria bacterium]
MIRIVALVFFAGLLSACSTNPVAIPPSAKVSDTKSSALTVPVHYTTLENGLRVVVSEDSSVPTATVAVYYNIGFRNEPRERTGFAHLFEHMMFQGSENLGKMEFIKLVQSNGGVLNGSTRFDFTNYYEVVPANKVETMLWAEADRMKGLAITQDNLTNQQGVVKNEVKVNVLNQPYGGFPWLDVPAYANENWHNNHNFYGDLKDLDAATLEDVQDFFDTFYAPNNAVLVVVGDVDTDEVMDMIERHFGDIEPSVLPPEVDISEPRQVEEKRVAKVYPKAPQPALAISYHMPERNSPEYYAMGIITELLLSGKDSLFYKKLVKEAGITSSVSGGVNLIGNMYNYNGPMNWHMSLIHDPKVNADDIMVMVDEVIEGLRTKKVSRDDIDLARTKMRSGFYSLLGSPTKFGVADLLAVFALFDDDPGRINRLEQEFDAVTPDLILRTAQEYLRPGNRLVLEVTDGQAQSSEGVAQ